MSQAVLSILNSDIGYIRPTLLSVGSQGKDVGVLQAYLRYNGFYAGLVTEDFDDLTKEAVLEYQTQHNLTVDGLVGAQTWTEMGFEVNIDGTVDTTCEYYQRYNECTDYYQKVQIGCEFIDSGEKYYIRNAYAGLQAAYTPNVANNPDIKLVELDGFDPQKFIITHTFDGYKIASVEDSSKVFTIDASNNTVKLATDIGSKLQRWCIEGDIDSFYVTNIEYPNSRLAVTSSSAGENLIMLNNFYYSIWRFNKITIEREMTPAINQQGVSICYRHDPEINRYDYYLDYTVPILQFLDSKESLCVSMSINTFDAYLLAYLGNETLARAAWWANIAATFTWFFYHVHSGGDWDIKIPEKWDGIFKEPPYDLPYIEFHKGYPNRHKFIFNDELCTTEELGNIMYGYTGTLAGIGDITLYWGGGVANLHSNGSSYPEAMLNPDTKNPNKNYGDRKEDHDAIEKGIALAYERRSNIISIGFNGIPVDELMQDILDEMISIGI